MAELPNLRAIRDWANGKFATYDKTSLPNGIEFGIDGGKYGYYDTNGNFQPFSSGGADLPDIYGVNFPSITKIYNYGGYITKFISVDDTYIKSGKYSKIKFQAKSVFNNTSSQSKGIMISFCIVFFKEVNFSTLKLPIIIYTLDSSGGWTSQEVQYSIGSTRYGTGKTIDGKNLYVYRTKIPYTVGNTVTTSSTTNGNTSLALDTVYSDFESIYEDAVSKGYDIFSNIDSLINPNLIDGSYYIVECLYGSGTVSNGYDSITLDSSIFGCFEIYRNSSTTNSSSIFFISSVTVPGSVGSIVDTDVLQMSDAALGEYNITLYN